MQFNIIAILSCRLYFWFAASVFKLAGKALLLSKIFKYNICKGESPRGVWGVCWPCNPRVSSLIPGANNFKKLLILMKIHGLTQKS